MKTIWKFGFSTAALNSVALPKGADILCLQMQRFSPCMWAVVDPAQPTERRTFVLYGTGATMVETGIHSYVGTYQELDGDLVWHLFELKEEENNG
ncbi:MAG: hypothetical protein ABGX83_05335 [Nitrospira sp.]